ncbi:MAG: FAD-binding oxidoreductase [Gammaproteobacteria bacterium]|nr:FAD-binding oxidoreductase [Gammaproteobacteria bacterium]
MSQSSSVSAAGHAVKRCVVIGAGIVGCNTAHALAERGMHVTLIERDRVGCGTSSHSFAWINATSKTADRAYHGLNALGAVRYRELARRFGERRIGLHPDGMLQWVSAAQADRLAELRDRFERLSEFGYPVLWVGRDQLCAMEPHVRFEADAEGLLAPADAWLDAPCYLRFMSKRLQSLGGTLLEYCSAQALELDDDGVVSGVLTTRGLIPADEVVVAAGPGSAQALADLTGFEAFASRFPLRQVPGLLVRTPPGEPRRLARHILYTADQAHLHIRDAGAGTLLIGADDTDGWISEDDSPSRRREGAAELLRRSAAVLDGFQGEALLDGCQIGMSVRPYPEDGKTIAGPVPGATGLHLLATHSGITMGAALGELMARSVVTGELAEQLEPFSLSRFQRFAG